MTFHYISKCPRGLYLICYCYWCWIWFLNYLGELLKAFWAAQHCVIEVFASSINATKCENIKMSLLPITAKYHNLLLVVVVWKYILSENTRFLNSIEVYKIFCVLYRVIIKLIGFTPNIHSSCTLSRTCDKNAKLPTLNLITTNLLNILLHSHPVNRRRRRYYQQLAWFWR